MTDANPSAHSTAGGATDAADPSMEEILASIRRILNEEEVPAVPPTPPADDGVLVLDEAMVVSDPEPEPTPRAVEPEPHPEPLAPPPVDQRPEPVPLREIQILPVRSQDLIMEQPAASSDLVAPEAAALAASSVSSLMRSLAAGRTTQVYSGGPTLEDIVRAELRPLMKEWLDVNLPPLVERLVRVEIERVVGRAVD